jgi:hypothetical protein
LVGESLSAEAKEEISRKAGGKVKELEEALRAMEEKASKGD